MPQKATTPTSFWAHVDKNGPIPAHRPDLGPCWIWTGATFHFGHGCVSVKGRSVKAHRYAWFLARGEWPPSNLRHHCDNPPCVRLDHLAPGTQADNMRDMVERGRSTKGRDTVASSRRARGESHGEAKLTDSQVLALRERRAAGAQLKVLAADFGVSVSLVSQIARGEAWKHLP